MGNHLIIIERRQLFAQSLALAFSTRGVFHRISLAKDAEDSFEKVSPFSRTVFLLSISTYEHTLHSLRALRRKYPEKTVVLLDSRFSQIAGLLVRHESVQGYWTYKDSIQELHNGVIMAANGESSITPFAREMFTHTKHGLRVSEMHMPNPFFRMTSRELEVMQYVASGIANKECAEKMRIAPKTLENMRTRIMNRLNIHRNIDLVLFARSQGFGTE